MSGREIPSGLYAGGFDGALCIDGPAKVGKTDSILMIKDRVLRAGFSVVWESAGRFFRRRAGDAGMEIGSYLATLDADGRMQLDLGIEAEMIGLLQRVDCGDIPMEAAHGVLLILDGRTPAFQAYKHGVCSFKVGMVCPAVVRAERCNDSVDVITQRDERDIASLRRILREIQGWETLVNEIRRGGCCDLRVDTSQHTIDGQVGVIWQAMQRKFSFLQAGT